MGILSSMLTLNLTPIENGAPFSIGVRRLLCAGRARLLAGALRERTKFLVVVNSIGNRLTEMRYESKSKSSHR